MYEEPEIIPYIPKFMRQKMERKRKGPPEARPITGFWNVWITAGFHRMSCGRRKVRQNRVIPY